MSADNPYLAAYQSGAVMNQLASLSPAAYHLARRAVDGDDLNRLRSVSAAWRKAVLRERQDRADAEYWRQYKLAQEEADRIMREANEREHRRWVERSAAAQAEHEAKRARSWWGRLFSWNP